MTIHSFNPSLNLPIVCNECGKTWMIQIDQIENMILYSDFLKCTCGKTKISIEPDGTIVFSLIEREQEKFD